MKAVGVVPRDRDIRVVDIEEPRIQDPDQVLVKMLEVGICGTDKEIARFEYGDPPPGQDVLILGHESFGQVQEVGAAVRGLVPGDLVVMTVRRPCGACFQCRLGRQDYCTTGDFVERGINKAHGFMTPYVVEDSRYCVPVPASLREIGVLLEPLTILEKGMQQLEVVNQRFGRDPRGQMRALVLGAGPVSALGAFALAVRGYKTTVVSRMPGSDPRASVLTRCGIEYVSSAEKDPARFVKDHGGQDVIYEGTGNSEFTFRWLQVLGQNGVAILTGIPGLANELSFDSNGFMRQVVLKNQVILGTVNADIRSFASGVKDLECFLERYTASVKEIISRRVPHTEVPALLKGQDRSAFKTVVELA